MKKAKSNQLELNFDRETDNSSKMDNTKKTKETIDYSFDKRLSEKRQTSDEKIYREIIMLAKHI